MISAKQVKQLREMTGIGMMECKKALEVTNGDINEAVEYLRKNNKNLTKVANRVATEGVCYCVDKYKIIYDEDFSVGIIVEINTETDFAARTDVINNLAKEISERIYTLALLAQRPDVSEFQPIVDKAISVLGEKVVLRRYDVMINEFSSFYAYNHQGRVSVLMEYDFDDYQDLAPDLPKNIALQIASMAPEYIGLSDIPQEVIRKEREIITAQVEADQSIVNKPDNIKQGIITGRLKKNLRDKCLLDQVYVKADDHKQTVAEYINSVNRKNNLDFKVLRFIRYELGEGLE